MSKTIKIVLASIAMVTFVSVVLPVAITICVTQRCVAQQAEIDKKTGTDSSTYDLKKELERRKAELLRERDAQTTSEAQIEALLQN